ncbi:MAG TPA: hypothetical protein VGU63_09410, partial [Candidatus Acidoferrales bacterium]|nr:hypothetical protein [Candidatus Acidoferrales bacterium]
VGDAYLQLRLAFPSPVLNYKTTLTGTAPTGDSSVGFSTGHATYDWTNHIDHGFGRWRPFAEAGVGNSTPEDFAFHRPYESYGHVAHFQAGTGFEIFQWLGASASAYDIAPWGTQTISSRLVNGSANALGRGGGHGRVFDLANQTTGSSSLAADNGFNAGADVSAGPLVDFSLGYSHSVHFDLNTFSFGIGINMSQVLHQARKGM